jgi:hypothetical protein
MKTAEGRLRAFIERSDRQYSPEERAENKRLLDDLRLAMVEYSEAFGQAIRSFHLNTHPRGSRYSSEIGDVASGFSPASARAHWSAPKRADRKRNLPFS